MKETLRVGIFDWIEAPANRTAAELYAHKLELAHAADKAGFHAYLIAEHQGKVDLLLTDVVMPNISGPELVRIARERWSNLRVLFMSGYADDELQDLDRDAGFIQKPFTPAELTAKIAEVLSDQD